MKKAILLAFILLFLLSTVLETCFGLLLTTSPEAMIYVDPPTSIASLGETFTVEVKIAKVKNLYAYQFKLKWEPGFLGVTNVTEGPFLNASGTYRTYFVPKIYNEPDPMGVSSYIYVACTLLGEPATAAASGNGTLATIKFIVNDAGNTSLHLHDTLLLNSMLIEISHGMEDSYFQCEECIVIDQAFVSDERPDVGSVQTIGFHAKWGINGSDVIGGSIYVNGTEYVTNGTGWINVNVRSSKVGKEEWVVTRVNCSGVIKYVQRIQNPSITWSQIEPTLTISLDSSSTYVGYKVKISGKLAYTNGTDISGTDLFLTYSVTGGESWNDITAVTTVDGDYYAEWMPTATGNYIVRIFWGGNEMKYVFSVISNSTISGLAFNSTSRLLSFDISGPSGTTGYTKVTIAKPLITDIDELKVYLDGERLNYTVVSTDVSWLLHFTYLHSTHKVVMSLGPPPAKPFIETPLGLAIITIAIIAGIIIGSFGIWTIRKRKRTP